MRAFRVVAGEVVDDGIELGGGHFDTGRVWHRVETVADDGADVFARPARTNG